MSPRPTYVISKNVAAADPSNATFEVEQESGSSNREINNQTVVVKSKPTAKSKISAASIMTEDDSDSDTGIRKYNKLKSKKDPKELFK